MFTTTNLLKNTSEYIPITLLDGPTNRKTVHGSADGMTRMDIAHQESNENPGLITQRSTVRITNSKEIEDSGKLVNGYVQLTLSVPRAEFSATDVQTLVAQLVNFLTTPSGVYAEGLTAAASDLVAVPRLYAGEP